MRLNLRLPEENLIYVMNSVCIAKLTLRFGSDCMHIKYFMYRNPNPIMPPMPPFLSSMLCPESESSLLVTKSNHSQQSNSTNIYMDIHLVTVMKRSIATRIPSRHILMIIYSSRSVP